VAQIGAAIGREFSPVLLASVARKTDAELGRRWIICWRLVCYFGMACRLMSPTGSSMRWSRMQPIAQCCGLRVRAYM
jgi:hypothetical protein